MTQTDHLNAAVNRRDSRSLKWTLFDEDVLPLWVADMDFRACDSVLDAMRDRVEHGVFGYQSNSPELRAVLVERLAQRHHMTVTPEQILFLPGLVMGLNLAVLSYTQPGEAVLTLTPVYPPFLNAPKHGRTLQTVPLTPTRRDHHLHYEIDFDALEAAITPTTKLFLLCNPHNPVGRVFTRAELERIADICQRHDLIIISDEIHCDLLLDADAQHISIASLSPEIAQRTVTLLAPSKTFNIPGLGLGFAVSHNAELLTTMQQAMYNIGAFVNTMGYAAALAAYTQGQAWLDSTLAYLRENRDFLIDYVDQHFPGMPITIPEGTFLAWMDCRSLEVENPHKFFLEQARVALNDGATFGDGGDGFVRINFACSREILEQALESMRGAVEQAQTHA